MKEVIAVKKFQGMSHSTTPGRYIKASCYFKDCLLYICGEGAGTDTLETRKISALQGIKRRFLIRPASLVAVLIDLRQPLLFQWLQDKLVS